MEYEIKEAVSGDLEALILCHSRFMQHHISIDRRFALKSGAEDKWGKQISEAIGHPDTLVLVAKKGSAVVGCAYTIIKSGSADFGPDKIGYLCDVYVEPEHRRKGVARRFLSAAKTWLQGKGIHIIEASWSVKSTEAVNTWPSLGFKPLSVSGQLGF